ncbi:MAG: transporter substrate-binding domain-containing protein [Pseudomonadota bacterium]
MPLRVLQIALLLCGLLATCVHAAPSSITVAVGSDSVPFYFQDKNGLPQGLVVDLWKLWSQKTGVAVQFKVASFGDTLSLVRQGQADVHGGCFQSQQRQQYLDFVTPVCMVQTNFFVHQNIFGVTSLQDLRGLRVGVIAGDYALEFLEGKLPPSSLAIYPDNQALFQAIARGDVLAFVKDTAIALDQLAELGILGQYRYDIERPLYQRPWLAAVRRGDREMAELVRQGMSQITPEERATLELRWLRSASVKTKDRLVIACPKGNAPFTTLTPSARPAGLLVDIWQLWAQKTNKKIEFRFSDWAGSLRDVERGDADIHSGLFFTAERAARFDVSPAFYGAESSIFYNPRLLQPTRLEDLAGQEVGVVAGSFLEQHLQGLLPGLRTRSYVDTDALVRAAVDGQVKVFAAEAATAAAYLDRLGEHGAFRRLAGWQLTQRLHAAVRKGGHELMSLVASGFKAISPQELAEIERRWIPAPELRYLTETPELPKLTPEEKAWLAQHKVIVLGAAQDYPPLDFIAADGAHQGLAAEYLGLLEKRLGIRIRAVSAFGWADMLEKAKRKELSGVACIAQSEGRGAFLKFTKPYFYSPYMVFTRKDHAPFASLEALVGQTIAVEDGFFLQERLREQYPRIKLLPVPNTQAALEAVAKGQAQAYVGNLLVAEYIIKRQALNDLRIACTAPWPGVQLRIGVRPDWPQLVSILDKALDTITTPEQAAINSRWLPPRTASLAGDVAMKLTPKEQAWLEGHRRLRLGVDPNWPPFEFIGPDKAYAGMASDYVRLVSEKLGVQIEVVPDLTWGQALEGAKTGKVDLLASAARTPERSKFLRFTKPYMRFPMVIATRDDAPFIAGLEDLAGKTVVVGQGYVSQELLAANHPELRLMPYSDIMQGLQAVSQGSAQAFVGNLATITYFTKRAGLTNLKIAASTPYSFDLAFAVRQDWPELTGILEKALTEITPAERDNIHNTWIAIRFEHGVDWHYVWKVIFVIVAACLALLGVFFSWNRRLQKAVTQRRQAEEALSKSEAQLRGLVESSADTIIVLDTERRIIDCNPAFSEQFGYSRREAVGQSARLVHCDDESYERFGREVYPSVRERGSWRGEWVYCRQDGSSIPMENVMSAFRGPEGEISGYSAVIRDITEQKNNEAALEAARHQLEDRVAERTAELQSAVQALQQEVHERQQVEKSLRKSEEEQRAVLNASPNCIIAFDNDRRVIYLNPAFTRVFGWSAPDAIGQRLDLVPPEESQSAAQAVQEAYRLDGGVHSFESRLNTKAGQTLDASVHITVFRDVGGRPVGLLAALEDITQRKRNLEELRRYREELENLVEERTAELEVAMEKAQEADRIKSAFLASMSHELRTPLNSIIGFTGIILQGLVGPLNEEQNKQMGMVQHSARHLLSLINDVLDISKIEAGQLKVELANFDLAQLINEVRAGLQPVADKKGLAFSCEMDARVGQVMSDRRRVEQVLINLLNNALKFTEQGEVHLECRVSDGLVVTSVRDSGIGIKPADQAKLFQPFRQIDTGLARRYEGTGLGLNICKRLMDLLGGRIWVESQGEGQGSTFTFTLPIERRGHDA